MPETCLKPTRCRLKALFRHGNWCIFKPSLCLPPLFTLNLPELTHTREKGKNHNEYSWMYWYSLDRLINQKKSLLFALDITEPPGVNKKSTLSFVTWTPFPSRLLLIGQKWLYHSPWIRYKQFDALPEKEENKSKCQTEVVAEEEEHILCVISTFCSDDTQNM